MSTLLDAIDALEDLAPAPPARAYKTPEWRREASADRRTALADEGLCINGRSHGPATHGKLCTRCRDVHNGGTPPPKSALTHCKRGHEFNEQNTRIRPDGSRQCRACQRVREYGC